MYRSFLIFSIAFSSFIGLSAQGEFVFSSNMTEQFRSNNGTYGIACGIAGKAPLLRLETEKLIREQNIQVFLEWIDSASHVHNAYAAEAIIRLSNAGLDFDDVTLKKVKVLKTSDAILSACRGCIYDQITIAEALQDHNFE